VLEYKETKKFYLFLGSALARHEDAVAACPTNALVLLQLMDGFNSATASLEKMMMEPEPIKLEHGMGHLQHLAMTTSIGNGVEEK
jgi:hypothetical protein